MKTVVVVVCRAFHTSLVDSPLNSHFSTILCIYVWKKIRIEYTFYIFSFQKYILLLKRTICHRFFRFVKRFRFSEYVFFLFLSPSLSATQPMAITSANVHTTDFLFCTQRTHKQNLFLIQQPTNETEIEAKKFRRREMLKLGDTNTEHT